MASPEERAAQQRAERAQRRAEYTQRFLSGEVNLPQQERVNVVDERTGRVQSVATNELLSTLQIQADGGATAYSLATEDDLQTHRRRQEAEGQGLETAALSALSGATLGLSDAALLAATEATQGREARRELSDRISTQREVNPTLSAAGEVGGAVAPALLSGGGSILARGGATAAARAGAGAAVRRGATRALASAPAGIVARAAEAAGVRAGATLGRRGAGRVVQGATRLATEGAIEGAVSGVGQAISESALTDTELTAENLLAAAGTGGLIGMGFGGALGGTFGAAGAAASRVSRGARRLLDQASSARVGRESVEAVQGLYRRAAGQAGEEGGEELSGGVAELYARASAMATGADAGDIRRLTNLSAEGRAARELVANADEVMQQAARQGAEVGTAADRFARSVMDESVGSFKADNVRRLTRGLDAADALKQADETLTFIQAQTDEMLTDANTWGARAAVNRISQDAETVRRRLSDIASKGGDNATADLFMELDQFKRRLGRNAAPGRWVADAKDSESLARIRDWYERTRQHLEVDSFYGDAAAAQKEVNAAWTRYLDASQLYRQRFLTRTGTDAFNPVWEVDPGKVSSYLSSTGKASNDLADRALRQHLEAQDELVAAISKHTDLSPAAQRAMADGREASTQMRGWLDTAHDQVKQINDWKTLQEMAQESASTAGSMVGAGIGAAAGGLLGMPVLGAAAGSAVAGLFRPDQAIRTLTALERINAGMGDRVQKAVRGLLTKGERAGSTAITAARRASRSTGRGARAGAVYGLVDFERKRDEVIATRNDSEFTARFERSTQPIAQAAPQVTAQMAIKAQQTAAFLRDKLPAGRRDRLQPLVGEPRVTDQDKARWLRFVKAAEDPMSVIDDIESGDLNREGVETLRALYPRLYEQVRTTTLETVASATEPIGYQQRIKLGILLEIPAHRSLEPDMIAALQSSFAAAEQAPPQSAPQPTGDAPDLASAAPLASDMESFERRRAAG